MIALESMADKLFIPKDRLKRYYPWLEFYMDKYSINTTLREAAFLAQIIHESGRFLYVEEIATGSAYEGRKDLGNTKRGDGMRYKGRGLIQLTGRANYSSISKDTGIDFVSNPELLTEPEYAVWSACWFWDKYNLNVLADEQDFIAITKKINGGTNGLSDRIKYYNLLIKNN